MEDSGMLTHEVLRDPLSSLTTPHATRSHRHQPRHRVCPPNASFILYGMYKTIDKKFDTLCLREYKAMLY